MPFFEGLARKFRKEEMTAPENETTEISVDFGSAEKRYKGQDSMFANDQVIAVADGVSSIKGGEVASNLAAMEMFTLPDLSKATEDEAIEAMRAAFDRAQKAIMKEYSHHLAMGEPVPATTLSAMSLFDNNKRAIIGNIGDSSVCRVRNGKILRLTPEDSLIAFFEDAGIKINYDEKDRASLNRPLAEAVDVVSLNAAKKKMDEETWDKYRAQLKDERDRGTTVNEARNLLMDALGRTSPNPHIFAADVEPGDVFLAFTDGLDKKLSFEEVGEIVSKYPDKSAKELAVLLANMGVDKDDTSVAVLSVYEELDVESEIEEQTAKTQKAK